MSIDALVNRLGNMIQDGTTVMSGISVYLGRVDENLGLLAKDTRQLSECLDRLSRSPFDIGTLARGVIETEIAQVLEDGIVDDDLESKLSDVLEQELSLDPLFSTIADFENIGIELMGTFSETIDSEIIGELPDLVSAIEQLKTELTTTIREEISRGIGIRTATVSQRLADSIIFIIDKFIGELEIALKGVFSDTERDGAQAMESAKELLEESFQGVKNTIQQLVVAAEPFGIDVPEA